MPWREFLPLVVKLLYSRSDAQLANTSQGGSRCPGDNSRLGKALGSELPPSTPAVYQRWGKLMKSRQETSAIQWLRKRPSRSEEHTSELQSLMRISYAVFCLKKKIYSKQH